MPALVLCGGRGTRLRAATEKPLVPVCGEPMVDRVVRAVRRSRVSELYAVPSPQTPRTAARARELDVTVVDAPGDGYVSDLQHALDVVGEPAVTVVADLPHLDADHIDRALAASASGEHREGDEMASVTVCVPVARKESLGVSVDTAVDHAGTRVAPTGLNVVGDAATETMCIVDDERLAVNVNRPPDIAVAESLC